MFYKKNLYNIHKHFLKIITHFLVFAIKANIFKKFNIISLNPFKANLSKLRNIFSVFLIINILSLYLTSTIAIAHDGPRKIGGGSLVGDDISSCKLDSLEYNPFNGADINWELTNPVCITLLTISKGIQAGAGKAVNYGCALQAQSAFEETQIAKDMAAGVAVSLASAVKQYKAVMACSYNMGICYTSAGANCGPAINCCASALAYAAALSSLLIETAIVYDRAQKTYENAKICGYDWDIWSNVEVKTRNAKGEEGTTTIRKRGDSGSNSYKNCLSKIYNSSENDLAECSKFGLNAELRNNRSMANKSYREYIYGGIEMEDNGSDSCSNPKSDSNDPNNWNSEKRIKMFGYDSANQRYYFRGPGVTANFACSRFLTTAKNDIQAQAAYDCCKRRSQEAICIESKTITNNSEYKLCKIGDLCHVGNVSFSIYGSKKVPNHICAKTYSVCPYNHPLGGGTETKQFKTGQSTISGSSLVPREVENYCQYMRHCIKIPSLPYVRTSNLDDSFISQSCRDFQGDSQNIYGFNAQIFSYNGFTAPLVQCFKETVENVFFNRAGFTKCANPDQEPDPNGICGNNNDSDYLFKKGEIMAGESFFVKITNKFRDIVKLVLTISVMFFGVRILMGSQPEKKVLFDYLLKIAIVVYFVIGNAWQATFMEGIIDSSNLLSEISFRPYIDANQDKRDGCQFPKYNYADKDDFTNPRYQEGKEYLRIWDTVDCKMARAIGMAPEANTSNLLKMIIAGFFTGSFGIIFVAAIIFFAVILISVVVRAAQIFIISIIGITILIYVSPITITMVFFEKTKQMFSSWLGQLLGFALQPMILCAYLGIFISLFDAIIVGKDVTFTGDGQKIPKQISCNEAASDNSVYCIFQLPKIQTQYTAFEALGIGIPVLWDSVVGNIFGVGDNGAKITSIIKAAILMLIFFNLMDRIPAFASELVGGVAISSSWDISATNIATKAFGGLSAVQVRGTRGVKKLAGNIARSGDKALESMRETAIYSRNNKNKELQSNQDQADASIQPHLAGGDANNNNPTIADNKSNSDQENNNSLISDDNSKPEKDQPETQNQGQEIQAIDQKTEDTPKTSQVPLPNEQESSAILDQKQDQDNSQIQDSAIEQQDLVLNEQRQDNMLDEQRQDINNSQLQDSLNEIEGGKQQEPLNLIKEDEKQEEQKQQEPLNLIKEDEKQEEQKQQEPLKVVEENNQQESGEENKDQNQLRKELDQKNVAEKKDDEIKQNVAEEAKPKIPNISVNQKKDALSRLNQKVQQNKESGSIKPLANKPTISPAKKTMNDVEARYNKTGNQAINGKISKDFVDQQILRGRDINQNVDDEMFKIFATNAYSKINAEQIKRVKNELYEKEIKKSGGNQAKANQVLKKFDEKIFETFAKNANSEQIELAKKGLYEEEIKKSGGNQAKANQALKKFDENIKKVKENFDKKNN